MKKYKSGVEMMLFWHYYMILVIINGKSYVKYSDF